MKHSINSIKIAIVTGFMFKQKLLVASIDLLWSKGLRS